MSLDQNLFTLSLGPSTEEPTALDLTDPSSNTVHYRKRRHPDEEKGEIAYAWGMYDPLSESLLATVTASSATAKSKLIELHNPSAKVPLAFTGTLTFKWCFDWEGHTFEWRREACFILRKPDPPVQVAVTREPAGRIKTSLVQLLDYNLNRFDIQDRKGLEIVMLSALLTFQDQSEEVHNGNNASAPSPTARKSSADALPGNSGPEVVEKIQVTAGTLQNEVMVAEAGTVEDYARHSVKMLKDESILYVVIKAQGEQQVPKVVQVAEAAKRMHYKSGGHDETLHQYVKWEDMDMKKKGPKVIKLDEPEGKQEYKPPQTIIIHLSKIPMPELQPKAPPRPSLSPTQQKDSSSRPMNWFGFGAGPSDAKSSSSSLAKASSASNLRPNSSPAANLRPNSSHPSPSGSPSPSRPPQPAPSPGPSKDKPKDKNRKDKDKEKEKKDKIKKGYAPPQQPPQPGWPGPMSGSPYGGRPSPQPPQMPGAMPSSPARHSFYGGFTSMNTQLPHKPSPNVPGGFAPPPGPPPAPGSQPAQPTGLTGTLTNQIANVGYNLLDRLTNNTSSTRPK